MTKEVYKLRDTQTGRVVEISLDEILHILNDARNEEWVPYTDDWRDGLEDFTDYELVES